MRADIHALAAGTLVLVLAPVGWLTARAARDAFRARRWSVADRIALAAGLALLALLLLRPHRDTFQALDSSAFRHMARAFIAGRGFHDRDTAFEELPPGLRPWVLMDATAFERGGRATRDRSFQIDAPERPGTRPFFYPLLPLNMAALGAWSGGRLTDYFVPAVFLSFWAAFLLFLGGRAGWRGIALALALAVASPLPAWLGRGCHLESVAAALLGLAVLHAFARPAGRAPGAAAFLAVGLAVSYHPIMILPALPIGAGLLATCRARRERWTGVVAGLLGVAPLFAMTEWICAPYGALRWSAIRGAIFDNPFIRPAAALLALLLALLGLGLALHRSGRWRWRIPSIGWTAAAALLLAWVAPTLAAASGYAGAGLAAGAGRGWSEWMDGLQWPAALLTLLLLLAVARRPGLARERWIVTAAALALPAFLHLKGLEDMGLWSQRRLLAPWLLLVTAGGSAGAGLLAGGIPALARFAGARELLLGVALAAGLANPVRWPAPYLAQYDRGADALVEPLDRELQGATVFFDHHSHSLPLAVLPGRRVYGLNAAAAPALPDIAAWIRQRAGQGPVYWITASEGPGLEDGVRLRSLGVRTATLERARARTVLPARRETIEIRLHVARVELLVPGVPAALDVTFDESARSGPDRPRLALRGPWGRGGIRLDGPGGTGLPARWTRDGSAVIAPVPAPGGRVQVTLEGAAGRRDGRTHQVVTVVPPWGGPGLELRVEQGYTRATGVLDRPAEETGVDPTGPYRIEARWPYDPAAAGIRGFEADLGVLLHRLRIESPPRAEGGSPGP